MSLALTRKRMLIAAALVTLPFLSAQAVAARATCATVPATELDRRVEREAQQGMRSFAHFVQRTRTVFGLDLRTEVDRLDARREAEEACVARVAAARTDASAAPMQAPAPEPVK